MVKQLDSTTNIESTDNSGIHGIYFAPHMTFSRFKCLASIYKHGLMNIFFVDLTTAKLNHCNQQVPWSSTTQKMISGFAIIVGLKMILTSSVHYFAEIFSNVSSRV